MGKINDLAVYFLLFFYKNKKSILLNLIKIWEVEDMEKSDWGVFSPYPLIHE